MEKQELINCLVLSITTILALIIWIIFQRKSIKYLESIVREKIDEIASDIPVLSETCKLREITKNLRAQVEELKAERSEILDNSFVLIIDNVKLTEKLKQYEQREPKPEPATEPKPAAKPKPKSTRNR